jgi:hypothetical protein
MSTSSWLMGTLNEQAGSAPAQLGSGERMTSIVPTMKRMMQPAARIIQAMRAGSRQFG